MPAHADQSVIQRVPLSQLFLSQLNVRKGEVEEGIPELADSILKDGVLQNLVGYEERPKRGSKKASRKEVTAGGRRWRALQLLLKQKKINGSYTVPFKLVSKAEAIVVSLIENAHRKPLHPADEFEAALALLEEGKSIEDIAARLHLEPIVVQRRLELARVAPEFIDDYRQGKLITLEHLMALAVTPDHKKQREVWSGLGRHQKTPQYIRNLLVESEIPASDPVAQFVTVEAYEKAGGKTRRDLFDAENEISLRDRTLVTELARKKLQATVAQLSNESLAWVDVSPVVADRAFIASYGHVQTTRREMTDEERARIEEFDREGGELDTEEEQAFSADGAPDAEALDDIENRRGELEEQRDKVLSGLHLPVPEQLAKSGALVCINHQGEPRVVRGLLRAEDAKLFAQQARREVKASQEGQDSEKPTHSAALLIRLTEQRTLALRAEFVQHPEVALAAVIDRFVHNTFHLSSRGHGNALEIVSPERYLGSDSTAKEGTAAALLKQRRESWSDRVRKAKDQFQFILNLPMAEKLELLAVATSATLNAVQNSEGPSEADGLAAALQLDLRRWWTPSAANYFESVSKEVILAALREHNVPQDKLAREAEKLLEGQGWLPAFLRSAKPDQLKAKKAKAA
jgi:ParB family chromosome partitioning protein